MKQYLYSVYGCIKTFYLYFHFLVTSQYTDSLQLSVLSHTISSYNILYDRQLLQCVYTNDLEYVIIVYENTASV